ncbi:branched-chain amino acid ABC transporter substrate-binding protein, partial [Rhizobium ruizarguesonis]
MPPELKGRKRRTAAGAALYQLMSNLLFQTANRFVDQDKVQAVIGHFCSSNTIPASEIYNDAGILEMTPSSTNPTVTDRGFDNLFR